MKPFGIEFLETIDMEGLYGAEKLPCSVSGGSRATATAVDGRSDSDTKYVADPGEALEYGVVQI